MEKIRSRSDLTAKGLAAVGTAAVGAIGYKEFANAFPAEGHWLIFVCLFLGPVLMICAVVALIVRFSRAGESVLTNADVEHVVEVNHLDPGQRDLVEEKYSQMAKLNEVDSLGAYQARGFRFERIADRRPAAEADPVRQRADQVHGEVLATQSGVAALIVRDRAKKAMTGWTIVWIFLFAGGWYSVSLSADALSAERTEKIEIAKSCAEARKAGADEDKLPGICGEKPNGDGKGSEASTAETIGDSVVAITESWRDCWKAAAKAKEDRSVCAPLQRARAAAEGDARGN
jgi:hypothetical protein